MRILRVPYLALLSAGSFLCLWRLQFSSANGREPAEDVLLSLALAALYGWPALFALARSIGAGAFGRSIPAVAIVLSPVLVTLALVACESYVASAAWAASALGIWVVAQVVVVPLVWAAARAWLAHHEPLPNNSSKPTPLRGAA